MSSAAVGTHSGAGPLSLMSCVRESSPLQDFDSDTEKNVASKRRFWNPRKWFKRRNKAAEDVIVVETSTEIGKDALRSRSTSELSVAEETKRRSSGPMHPGLSVSHDSVFHSPNSGSDMELDAAQSSSSLSISQHHIDLRLQSELNERLRLRRGRGDTSEDDEGFPHSSCNSPTTSDGLLLDKTGIKDLPVKSHSTCSDGSLLSMGSSEMDEDSLAPQSRHSSKLSLYDKKSIADSQFEIEPSASSTPLNHSAAHHRVAVKPKRTHGAPRRKRGQQLTSALPATPEVNEDPMIRSTSPEINRKETLTELYSMSATSRTTILTETQLKCSSLPPGLTAPGSETSKLNRSKSNAGSKSQDEFEDDKEEKPSLFDRIFPRRSGRKKRQAAKEEPEAAEATKARSSAPRPVPAPRSGPASRQRVQPCDIPATPDEVRREPPGAEMGSASGTSPLQVELENRFKQRQFTLSTSPPKPKSPLTPPRSPKSPKAVENSTSVISSKSEHVHHHQHHHTRTSHSTTHSQTKPKIAGLSSLQQRVLALNSDEADNAFKSLTEAQSVDPRPPITKSLSFKSARRDAKSTTEEFLDREREQSRVPFAKAASLDSVKNLEDPPRQPEATKSEDSLLKLKTEENVELFRDSTITITGPSHTAVVNVTTTTSKEDFAATSRNHTVETVESEGSHKLSVKEHQVSVTKIQVKRESTEVSQSTITVPRLAAVPEFFNKQLNKVETKPSTNIIFSMKSPKPMEESDHRPKTLFDFDVTSKPPAPRRFSKENLEIIEKDQETSPKTPTFNRFKKYEPKGSRKSSVVSITPDSPVREIKNVFKSRSTSLDSLSSDKSSQDSLDKLEEETTKSKESPTVILRKKSVANQKSEEEPELMKVFARRSLKLKDNEIDAIQENLLDVKTRDSDKENQIDSPVEDRTKWSNEAINNDLTSRRKEPSTKKEDIVKEPLVENKTATSDVVKNNRDSPPTLRRTFNSNIFAEHRAVSLNPPKATPEFILRKQPSFQEHRKVDGWISKHEERDIVDDRKSEFITEPKNFSQRKAEWEKRAQQAQRKTTP